MATKANRKAPSSGSGRTGRKTQTKAERRAETIEQILDEAEYLFSRHGFYGVTLKDVAKRVGVHHTLLNYYFNDKDTLFEAVFGRRAEVTRDKRMQALDEYERENADNLTVEGALHTFLDTDLDLYSTGGEGWRNYGTLASQVANTPEWGAKLMDKSFDPTAINGQAKEGWELQNMLTTALLVASAARYRTESRGVHYRTDYPERDDRHWRMRLRWARPMLTPTPEIVAPEPQVQA